MIAIASFEDGLSYHPFGGRNLKLTSPETRGTDVKVLQTLYNLFLTFSAPPHGPLGTPITADGIFGPKTSAAVKNWQSYFGLSVDGVVGPVTFFSFGQGVRENVTYGGPAFGSRALHTGETGGDVTVAQNRLNVFRYATITGGPADGVYGSKTEAAVRAFQTDAQTPDPGVPVDGQVHFETFDAFWILTYLGGRGLFEGRNGIDTLFLQRFLRPTYYQAALDGYFGAKTRDAVRAFQAAVGISVDGIAGQRTYYEIGLHFNHPAGTWP